MNSKERTNSPREKEFFSALKNLDLVKVKALAAEDGKLLKAYDYASFGGPCLNLLCWHSECLEMIEALIELGADPNQESDWDAGPWSPAQLAINCGNPNNAKLLLSKGARLDIHVAAGLAKVEELRAFCELDPSLVNKRGGDGASALHFAGSCEVVDILLEYGADTEMRCIDHFSTPVQWLARRRPEVARYLFKIGAQADIMSASVCGASEVVEALIEKDPSVLDWRINQTYFPLGPGKAHNILYFSVGMEATALHAAAVGNQSEVLKMLVQKGIDVNITGAYDNCTALHLAAFDNNPDVVKTLLELGASIEQQSGELHENTPLGWAIVAGSVEAAKVLLESGCEIRDYYREHCEHGMKGGFLEIKVSPIENFKKIDELIAGR